MKVYEIITEQIIEKLESGSIPWHQPWSGSGYPVNLITKKPYRGINVFLLLASGYASPYWMSYKQAEKLGGQVRKGEKSTMIVFWKQVKIKDKDEEKTIPMLRYYRVFNSDQVDGLNGKLPVLESNQNFQPLEICESVIKDMPTRPVIQHKENRAFYHPKQDFVNMPKKESFDNESYYYSVLFHELGHSTGHESRLARKNFNAAAAFGSERYSKEELVAEMTAAFLCGHCEIIQQTLENSAAYIQGWLGKLKDDPKMVVLAAAQAHNAADYILSR